MVSKPLPDPRSVASSVADPELPMVTLSDLGVIRDIDVGQDGRVVVSITPTYSGCPAIEVMRRDLHRALRTAGYRHVKVRTVLEPAWTSDWISDEGRRKLSEAGIAPPGRAKRPGDGPILLTLGTTRRTAVCPQCGSGDTSETSEFSSTPCKALRRCRTCQEPFEHFKEI